jgi:hypothetical protein
VDRRILLTGSLGLLAAPLAAEYMSVPPTAEAQQAPVRPYHVGVLHPAFGERTPAFEGLAADLRPYGWRPMQTLQIPDWCGCSTEYLPVPAGDGGGPSCRSGTRGRRPIRSAIRATCPPTTRRTHDPLLVETRCLARLLRAQTTTPQLSVSLRIGRHEARVDDGATLKESHSRKSYH